MGDLNHLGADGREDDDADLRTPEDAADRLGIRTALLVTCLGLFIGALWLMNSPSFQKCSGLDNLKDRIACYESVRNSLLAPPIK